MSYHRACCCGRCPYDSVMLTVSGVTACPGCRSPYPFQGDLDSVNNVVLDVDGAYTLPFIGESTIFDALGEWRYYGESAGIQWSHDYYASRTDCGGVPNDISGRSGMLVYQNKATCQITRILVGTPAVPSSQSAGMLDFATEEVHDIGVEVASELNCDTAPPVFWPGYGLIKGSGGVATVTR